MKKTGIKRKAAQIAPGPRGSLYYVLSLKTEVEIESPIADYPPIPPIKVIWSPGMVGAFPVFSSWKDAYRYAGDRFTVLCCTKKNVTKPTHG